MPPPPLTGEHIWPDWYNRQQPNFWYELESVIAGEVSIRSTNSMNLKPKTLCHSCNHEWGSDLEKRAAPLLTPMMRGEPRRLGRDTLQLISAWFFLKALVAQYLVPDNERPRRFFGLQHGRYLKATLEPPEGLQVWMGQYVGTRSNAGWITDRSSVRWVSVDPPAGSFWHSTTYSIGQVLLHLAALSVPIPLGDLKHLSPRVDSGQPTPGDWDASLIQVWPPPGGSVSWPPEKAFDDDGFVYLADRWNVKKPPSSEPTPDPLEPPDLGGA